MDGPGMMGAARWRTMAELRVCVLLSVRHHKQTRSGYKGDRRRCYIVKRTPTLWPLRGARNQLLNQ